MRILRDPAQDRVHERRGRRLARFLHHLDRFVHGRARGNLLQESELISSDSQRELHGQIELLDRLLELTFKQEIEQSPPAQDAHGDLGCEGGVGGLDVCAQLGVQHVARVRAFRLHAAQHLERDLSGRGNGHGAALRAEALARLDARPAHELDVRDALAPFELEMFHVQDGAGAANHQQTIFLGRQDDAGCSAGSGWLERLAPNLAVFSAKGCERAGPRLQAANAVVNCERAERPIDSPVFLLEDGRKRRLRIVLRRGRDLAAIELPQRFDDQRRARFGELRSQFRCSFVRADPGFDISAALDRCRAPHRSAWS